MSSRIGCSVVACCFHQRLCFGKDAARTIRISPRPNGEGSWVHGKKTDTSRYIFSPTRALDPEITVRLKVRKGLRACNGNVLAKAYTFSFKGDAWELALKVGKKVINWYPKKGRPRLAGVHEKQDIRPRSLDVLLIFDQLVSPTQIKEYLRLVASKSNASKPFVLRHPQEDLDLLPREHLLRVLAKPELPPGLAVRLELAKALIRGSDRRSS